MSIEMYIHDLREKKDISYMQLAKEMKITYANMMSLKNGLISSVTVKLLEKIATYEKRKKEDVLFDIFSCGLEEYVPDISLRYLSSKFIEGNIVTIPFTIPNFFFNKQLNIDGSYSVKRIGTNHTIVQSWDTLCEEHWSQYNIQRNIPYSRDVFSHLFRNEEAYIASVIAYGVQRIQIAKNSNFKGYDILFTDRQEYYLKQAEKFLPSTKYLKVNLIIY